MSESILFVLTVHVAPVFPLSLRCVQCELVGGVVVCMGGMVNVHKVNEVQISIQGALCEEYFRIRELLYQQYQIV